MKRVFGLITGVGVFFAMTKLQPPIVYIALFIVAYAIGNQVLDIAIAFCDLIKDKIKERNKGG